MQYREVAWAQQLYFQRLLHGPAAEVTERRYAVLRLPGKAAGSPLELQMIWGRLGYVCC